MGGALDRLLGRCAALIGGLAGLRLRVEIQVDRIREGLSGTIILVVACTDYFVDLCEVDYFDERTLKVLKIHKALQECGWGDRLVSKCTRADDAQGGKRSSWSQTVIPNHVFATRAIALALENCASFLSKLGLKENERKLEEYTNLKFECNADAIH